MTETTEPTREELKAEIEALRSTRDRSPVKPTDHKPADEDTVSVEYDGTTFTVRKGILSSLKVLRPLEKNHLVTALEAILGEDAFNDFLEKNPEADAEDAGKIFELIVEKAGAKNS